MEEYLVKGEFILEGIKLQNFQRIIFMRRKV